MKDQCANCAGATHDADLPHIAASERHCRLLASYLLNLDRGVGAVRGMIADDMRRCGEMGATRYANDLKVVMACFVEEFEACDANCEAAA